MKRRKLRVCLLEFLTTGRFGPFSPCREASPESLIEVLGVADSIDVCAYGKVDHTYKAGDPACFPVIVHYGTVEFHFDSPSTLFCIMYDNPFKGGPTGNAGITFSDVALLKYRRPMREFFDLCKGNALEVSAARPYSEPYGLVVRTVGGVDVGFEVDDAENRNEEPTLRWCCLDLR